MSHFRLHTKAEGKDSLKYLIAGVVCALFAVAGIYVLHSIGTAGAKSRETVLIHTAEELEQYLLDEESEEYNLNGSYRLEEDMEIDWLYRSIGNQAEPFTGKFDGNGHVMSGQMRPLFGVVERAEIENLFLSGAIVTVPFTYYDGERYVDGYGAVAAYAVDSTIRNCGVTGDVFAGMPIETEYLLEKASPADAEEWLGPGKVEMPGGGESTEVGSSDGSADIGAGGNADGSGGGNSGEIGPGLGTGGADETNQAGDEEKDDGPGVESTDMAAGGTEQESSALGSGNVGESENVGGNGNGGGESTEDSAGNIEGTTESNHGSTEPAVTEPVESNGTESGSEVTDSTEAGNAGTGNSETGDSGAGNTEGENTGTGSTGAGNTGTNYTENGDDGTGQPEVNEPDSGNQHARETQNHETALAGAIAETVGYRGNERQRLMLKVSPVVDPNAESIPMATPSDAETSEATPSNAEESTQASSGSSDTGVEPTEETVEYIGNPNGDIWILVTAEQITAGGLTAQTAGDTLISDSFALVTIGAHMGGVETYAGGLAGILGERTRTENSYAAGTVDAAGIIAGFAAVNEGIIENSFSTTTVGDMGIVRGAFTASGDGSVSGCVYDRQIACVDDEEKEHAEFEELGEAEALGQTEFIQDSEDMPDSEAVQGPGVIQEADGIQEPATEPESSIDIHAGMKQIGPGEWVETESADVESENMESENTELPNTEPTNEEPANPEHWQPEPEFSLKALNTTDMTGINAQIPGNWYKTENAYPQLEYFAVNEQELISSSSKASAVALVLPDGYTLADVLSEGALVLPTELDGQSIEWEANGGIAIDENNQVVTHEKISYEPNQVPNVGSALNLSTPFQAEESQSEATEEAVQPDQTPADTNPADDIDTPGDPENPTSSLRASINGVGRSFSVSVAAAAADTDIYANWAAVGAAVETGGKLDSFQPTQNPSDNFYEIETPEALAWFAYQVNVRSKANISARLMNDIDLYGAHRSGNSYNAASPDYDKALLWTPIGSNNGKYFKGTFDGNNKKILNMSINTNGYAGFFGYISDNALIMDLGLASGRVKSSGPQNGCIVGFCGGNNIKVLRCWNGATMETGSGYCFAGVVGGITGCTDALVEGCYNLGTINGRLHVSGVVAAPYSIRNVAVRNCYNLGSVNGESDNVAGIVGCLNYERNGDSNSISIENCYNVGSVNSGTGIRGGIVGKAYGIITNNYYTNTNVGNTGTRLTDAQMKSWAAAYALNGQSLTQTNESGLSWSYDPNVNDGYPYLSPEGLRPANSWQEIGQGMLDGLIAADKLTNTSGTYHIKSAEQLAAFSALVNSGSTGINALLEIDIDLAGEVYGGSKEEPIPWIPIGTEENFYRGTFDGNGKAVGHMKVEQSGYAGMFGCAGGGAVIKTLGLDTTCSVKALSSSTSTSAFVGAVKSVANANPQIVIENCYNRASVTGGNEKTAAFVGSDEGVASHGDGTQRITNCYTTGIITASSGVTPSAIAGTFTNGTNTTSGGIRYCYWDESTSSASGVTLKVTGSSGTSTLLSGKKASAYMKSATFLNDLNTMSGGNAWGWLADKNDGYPIFSSNLVDLNWSTIGAIVQPPYYKNMSKPSTAGTAANPYLLYTPEHLAWFAYQVNAGKTTLCAEVRHNLDMAGGIYTGISNPGGTADKAASAILWVPAGSSSASYTGTFLGNGYTISNMRVEGVQNAGLFGALGSGAHIKRVELAGCLVSPSGQYAGGIAGSAGGTGIVVEGCTVDSLSRINASGKSNIGGILGGALSGTVNIRNCYNQGKVTGGTNVGGIVGNLTVGQISASYNAGPITADGSGGVAGNITGVSSGSVTNCLYDNTYACGAGPDSNAIGLKTEDLKSWSAAWKLNGENYNVVSDIAWTYQSGSYPVFGVLGPAENWKEIGRGAVNGTITSGKPAQTGDVYLITNGEQLAWLAYQVSILGNTSVNARLERDIDLFGSTFTGRNFDGTNMASALEWMPIGYSTSNKYTGVLDGNQKQIKNMWMNRGSTWYSALIGVMGENAVVKDLGVATGKVVSTGSYAAGIAGYAEGKDIKLLRCWNGIEVKGSRIIGGIVGGMTNCPNLRIEGCYNLGDIAATGDYSAGIVSAIYACSNVTVKNCYNLGAISGVNRIAGIVGYFNERSAGPASMDHCYNAGKITGNAYMGGVCGTSVGVITDCYYDNKYAGAGGTSGSGNTNNPRGLTTAQLQSWAAAYALNGYGLSQADAADSVWNYNPGDYPTLRWTGDPAQDKLVPAADWSVVGQGVEDKLIGINTDASKQAPVQNGVTGAYQIGSAEQLAWFAGKVNGFRDETGDGSVNGDLTANIDSMAGTAYGGTDSAPLPWIPINQYSGKFGDGNAERYQIGKLRISQTGQAGLFGTVTGSGGSISKIGLVNSSITGDTAGGIAAVVTQNAVVSKCFNKSQISANGTADSYIGGIAGKVSAGGVIKDCYNMDSVITSRVTAAGKSSYAGGIAGGVVADGGAAGSIQNSYHANSRGGASGSVTASGTAGSIAGTAATGAISRCYSDTKYGADNAAGVIAFDFTSDEMIQKQTDDLNTVGDAERMGNDRAWYTSLTAEDTHGLPTLKEPVIVEVSFDPAEIDAGADKWGVANVSGIPAGARLRGIHQENSSSADFNLTPVNTLKRDYPKYGTVAAGKNLAFSAGTGNQDLGGLTGSLTAPSAAGTITGFERLTLYLAPAYLDTAGRTILVDVSSGTARYEIRARIEPLTSKTVSLVFSANPTIELQPGMHRRSDSSDVTVTNQNGYPIEGRISGVTPMEGMDTKLTPILAKLPDPIDESQYLEAAGVKLGITGAKNTAETVIGNKEFYYNPKAGGTWITYQIGSKNKFSFRYFMEYSPLYAGEKKSFGYEIQYSVSISEHEVAADVVTVSEETAVSGG